MYFPVQQDTPLLVKNKSDSYRYVCTIIISSSLAHRGGSARVQEEDLPPVHEEDRLPVQEEHLLVQGEDPLFCRYLLLVAAIYWYLFICSYLYTCSVICNYLLLLCSYFAAICNNMYDLALFCCYLLLLAGDYYQN